MGVLAGLLLLYLLLRIVKMSFGSGVSVTTHRRRMADGSEVVEQVEEIVATKFERWTARVVLAFLIYSFAKLTWMLQLWSF